MNEKMKQILIADDDQDLLEILSERCKSLGLDVIGASDAMDALANADFHSPDIAILDVKMPGGNGISVSEMMATDDRLSSTALIIMTGDPNETVRQRCKEIGAHLVAKDQLLWTRVEPLLRQLLHPSYAPPGASVSGISDIQDRKCDATVATMLDGWGWFNETPQEGNLRRIESAESEQSESSWVLAIDDDPDFTLGLQKRLLSFDVQLIRAYRGMDGYRTAFRGRPAAILLDYQMPDGNGDYVLRRLKESTATDSVPVIVITGMADNSLQRRMIAAGADAFLNKPVTWNQLKRTLVQYSDLDLRSKIVPHQTVAREALVCC